MTNGEKIQHDFECEVCEPIIEDNIIHVIFADKSDSAIGFDWDWWNLDYKEPTTKNETFGSNNPLEWLGKNCKDCGNEKCKKLGTLPKGYSCALWQPESEE